MRLCQYWYAEGWAGEGVGDLFKNKKIFRFQANSELHVGLLLVYSTAINFFLKSFQILSFNS